MEEIAILCASYRRHHCYNLKCILRLIFIHHSRARLWLPNSHPKVNCPHHSKQLIIIPFSPCSVFLKLSFDLLIHLANFFLQQFILQGHIHYTTRATLQPCITTRRRGTDQEVDYLRPTHRPMCTPRRKTRWRR